MANLSLKAGFVFADEYKDRNGQVYKDNGSYYVAARLKDVRSALSALHETGRISKFFEWDKLMESRKKSGADGET